MNVMPGLDPGISRPEMPGSGPGMTLIGGKRQTLHPC